MLTRVVTRKKCFSALTLRFSLPRRSRVYVLSCLSSFNAGHAGSLQMDTCWGPPRYENARGSICGGGLGGWRGASQKACGAEAAHRALAARTLLLSLASTVATRAIFTAALQHFGHLPTIRNNYAQK